MSILYSQSKLLLKILILSFYIDNLNARVEHKNI